MKIKTVLPALLCLAKFIAPGQTTNSALLNEAAKENAQSNFLKAIRLYDRVIEQNTDSAKYYFYRGQDYAMIKESKSALQDYSKAISLNPAFFDTYDSRAILYYSIYEPEKSINDYNQALVYCDTSRDLRVFLHNNRGNAKALRHDLKGAYADYLEALKLDAQGLGTLQNIGEALNQMDRTQEAAMYLAQLTNLSPDNINGRNELGYSYLKLNRFEEAIQQFDIVLKLDPRQALTLNNRGLAKYNLQDYVNAMDDVNQAITLSPQNAYSYRNRALIYFAGGKIEAGCANLLQAVRLGYIEKYGPDARELYAQNCGEAKF